MLSMSACHAGHSLHGHAEDLQNKCNAPGIDSKSNLALRGIGTESGGAAQGFYRDGADV